VAIGLALPAIAVLILLGRMTIRILFERGEFTAAAGDLTYQILVAYAIGLPAYVATEVITRGLVAVRDTRTPLFTNLGQLLLRATLMAVFIGRVGAIAIPMALAISSALETIILAVVLYLKLGRLTLPGKAS
jgi:putative peptidoglycan lipid II flippase